MALSCHQRNRSGVQVGASRTSEPRPPTPPFQRQAPEAGGPRLLPFGKAVEAVVDTDKAACKLALSLQQSSQQCSKFQAQVNCERLHHPSSSGLLLLLQNSSNLSRILPHVFEKKQEKHSLHISIDSTTMQVLGFYFSYGILQICPEYSPHFFEKNRGSILWTFRATPPPFKSWAPTPPVTPASDLSI